MSLERLKNLPYYTAHTHKRKWTKCKIDIEDIVWGNRYVKQYLDIYINYTQRIIDSHVIMTAHRNGVPMLDKDVHLRDTCTVGFLFPQPRRERIFGNRSYTPQTYLSKTVRRARPDLERVLPLVEVTNVTKKLYDSRIHELIEKIENEKHI